MVYKPTDWLGPLIERDIQAAIAWYKRTATNANIKRDPSPRFEDDGSNLRSEVESPPLSDDNTLQIVKTLSADDALFIVSDGFTSLRARLSAEAATTLAAEVDGGVCLDTSGEVFTVRGCTISSTPYGPTEEQVQLFVQKIEYQFHLHRIAGAATPVEGRPEVSRLQGEVMILRHPEPAQEATSAPADSVHNAQPRKRPSDRFETQAKPQSPASQVGVASSPAAAMSQASQTQRAIATQLTSRHRKTAPNMARDGIEMAAGVNLDRPTAAIPSRFAQNEAPSGPPGPAPIADRNAHLLSVLGKRKAVAGPHTNAEQHQAIYPKTPPVRTERASPSVASVVTGRPKMQQIPNTADSAAASLSKKHATSPLLSGKPNVNSHWRRKIPKDQRNLLDSPAAWLPSLPGRQFPRPNVPIELLKRWNDQTQTKPDSVVLSHAESVHSADHSPRTAEVPTAENELSSEEEDSDEEVTWSSSPPRPALIACRTEVTTNASAHENQPSSSLSSSPIEQRLSDVSPSSRPPTAGKHSERPPDSSFEHPVAPRALGQQSVQQPGPGVGKKAVLPSQSRRDARPTLVQATPNAVRQTASPRSDQHRGPKGIFSPGMQSQTSPLDRNGRIITPRPLDYRSDRATKPTTWVEIPSPWWNAPQPSSTPSARQVVSPRNARETSPDVQLLRVRQSPAQPQATQIAPPSRAATVIRATQINGDDSDPDVMEIDPPARIDPTSEHQKRRSQYLKGQQRRRWIKANYTPTPKAPFSIGALCSAYKKAYPKDEVRPSELAEAYEEIYPEASLSNTQRSPSTSTARTTAGSENVASTAKQSRASLADLDASDSTPSKTAKGLRKQREREPEGGSSAVNSTGVRSAHTARPDAESMAEPVTDKTYAYATRMREPAKKGKAAPGDGMKEVEAPRATPSRSAAAKQGERDDVRKASDMVVQAALRSVNPSPAGSVKSTVSRAKTAPEHRPWLVKRIESDQRKLETERLGSKRKGEEQNDSFLEFAGAWREIRPGGAFAKVRSGERESKKQSVRLDVLGWEL